MKGRVDQMKRSKKSLLILAIVVLLTVALPLAGALANPQTTPPSPPVQQLPNYYPSGFYCCGFGPWNGQMNPNYQQNSWRMGPMW